MAYLLDFNCLSQYSAGKKFQGQCEEEVKPLPVTDLWICWVLGAENLTSKTHQSIVNGPHTFAPVFECVKWLSFYSLRQEGSRYSMILVLILIQCLCLNLLWQAHFWSVNLVVGTTMAQRISAPNMSDQICWFSQVQSVAVQIRWLNQIAFADFAALESWAKTTKLDSLIAPGLVQADSAPIVIMATNRGITNNSGHRLQESTRLLDNVGILGYVGVLPLQHKGFNICVGGPPTDLYLALLQLWGQFPT